MDGETKGVNVAGLVMATGGWPCRLRCAKRRKRDGEDEDAMYGTVRR